MATIGPSSSDKETLSELIDAGMNVARLNFSHGTHESHGEMIDTIRELSDKKHISITVLQDLCGPKIRLGILPDSGIVLKTGETCVMAAEEFAENGVIPVQYPYLADDLKIGDRVLLADGSMELKVEEINDKNVVCRILHGGTAYTKKGVNMPDTSLSIVAFTDKDKEDLLFGLEKGVDAVALSFVRSAADLVKIRSILAKHPSPPLLIAKIEKPQAVDNIDEILTMVDGIMVARGDLGVEMPLYEVPVIQKLLIKKASAQGKITITATQMLKSMVENFRPTRAECADVANAMFDGTYAVMLSEETASGQFPVEAVRVMDSLALATESHISYELNMSNTDYTDDKSISWAVGRSASWLAKDLNAKAIIAYTESGFTVSNVAQFRPSCPVLGLTPNLTTYRRLSLYWGVTAGKSIGFSDLDDLFTYAAEHAVSHGLAKKGDRIIITAGTPLGVRGSTNIVKVFEI